MSSMKPVFTASSSKAIPRLCQDRGYPSRHVPDLPRTCRGLSVDYATEDQLPTCHRMILDSARRGDNIGLDEYSDDDEDGGPETGKGGLLKSICDSFSSLLTPSEIFVVHQPGVSDPEAFIVIQPCPYTRTWDTRWASVHVFCSERLQRQAADELEAANRCNANGEEHRIPLTVFGDLLELGVSFTSLVDIGYTDCMFTVADRCSMRVDEARRLGFVVIATIPESVDLAGHGLRPDLLMAKSIDFHGRQRRPTHEIVEMAQRVLPPGECEVKYRAAEPHSVEFLPQRYTFRTGLEVVVRLARTDEDRSLFEIMKSTTRDGLGYGFDEFPTLESFRKLMLADHVCLVFEDERNTKVVGFTSIGDSAYVRTRKSAIYDACLVIEKSYRGRGIGGEAVELEAALAAELGYRKSINDWLGSNRRMAHVVISRLGSHVTIIGMIQSGTFTAATPTINAGVGHRDKGSRVDGEWDDQILTLHDMVGIQTFSEMARLSRKRPGAGSELAWCSKL